MIASCGLISPPISPVTSPATAATATYLGLSYRRPPIIIVFMRWMPSTNTGGLMPIRPNRSAIAALIIGLGVAFGWTGASAANLDEACGGPTGITCNSALWCQKAEGQCAVADAPGKCDKPVTFCMRVSRPVCGCNGKTYANDCERQRVKVQLDHTGACPKEPKPATPKEPKAKKK
jgi:hypothetical protein